MNIRDLKLFKHLAQTLHFGKTSRECNITPSGLTRTIQRLEHELGHSLFHRDNRSVELSTAGAAFYSYCEESIGRWNSLQNNLSGNQSLQGGISLYCSVTAVLTILPAIFRRFREEHPAVKLSIETGDAADALQKIDSKEVDLSVIALPTNKPEKFNFIEFLQTPLIFIAPRQHGGTVIHKQQGVDWGKTPLILPRHGLSRHRADMWFAQKNIRPNIYSEVAGHEAIIAMVAMGCGIGVVPQLVMEKSPLASQVNKVTISPELKPFEVGACVSEKKLKEPVIKAFWQTASNYQKEITACTR